MASIPILALTHQSQFDLHLAPGKCSFWTLFMQAFRELELF